MKKRGFLFQQVQARKLGYSAFDYSYENRLTSNFAELIPTSHFEVYPGDVFDMVSTFYIQAAPMVAPAFQRMDALIYNFFVSDRLVADQFDEFITNGNGKVKMRDQSSYQAPIPPYFTLRQLLPELDGDPENLKKILKLLGPGSLGDFMHLGMSRQFLTDLNNNDVSSDILDKPIEVKLFRMYQLIFNEFFRDQNLMDEVEVNTSMGAITTEELESILTLRYKCWEKDYLTSALPTPQRGAPVQMPIDVSFGSGGYINTDNIVPTITNGRIPHPNGDTIGVGDLGSVGFNVQEAVSGTDGNQWVGNFKASFTPDPDNPGVVETRNIQQLGGVVRDNEGQVLNVLGYSDTADGTGRIPVNLDSVHATSSTTIEDLRHAFRLQEFLEKAARFGSRLKEAIKGHWDEDVPDYRIDRPQFLSSTRIPISVGAVSQTSATVEGETPQAYKAGQASGSGSGARFKHRFHEHGYVIQLMAIMPRTGYATGAYRDFFRFDYLDYAWPEFDQLGEQEIKSYELNWTKNVDPNQTFGYTPRYAELKYHPDEVHSDFLPGESLHYWTLARSFGENGDDTPLLNESFVQFQPSESNNRIFAVPDDDVKHFYVDIWHSIKAYRKLHEYGTPTF